MRNRMTQTTPIAVTDEMVKRAFLFWHTEEELPLKPHLLIAYREMLEEALNG